MEQHSVNGNGRHAVIPDPATVMSAHSLHLRVDHDAGRLIVHATGDIDVDAEDHFSGFLSAAIDQASAVVVDLSAVGFMDSSGLSALVGAVHRARRQGGELTVRDPSVPVRTLLELSGVDQILDIEITD